MAGGGGGLDVGASGGDIWGKKKEGLEFMCSDFTTNPQRLTPYANFRFKLAWEVAGTRVYVAGLSKVSGLSRTTEVIRHRAGGDPSDVHLEPGQSYYAPITLERGLSYDPSFETWANAVFDLKNSQRGTGQATDLHDIRKDVTIDMFNEAGQRVLSYIVVNAWVSEFTALPELDAMGNAVVIESMVLQNEGWSRDDRPRPQAEPEFIDPSS